TRGEGKTIPNTSQCFCYYRRGLDSTLLMKQKFCQEPTPPSSPPLRVQRKLWLKMRTCSLPVLKALASAIIFAVILWNLNFLGYHAEVPGPALGPSKPLTVLIWHWPFHHTPNLSTDVCADRYGLKGCHLTGTTGSLARQMWWCSITGSYSRAR
ncbi:fucosyltransferase 7, partial [Chelydra serpentina]